MFRPSPSVLALALCGAGLVLPTTSQAAEDFSALWEDGKPILDLRYRYEHVDQDNTLRHANAQTLRTRVGWQTGRWLGFSALVEVDNVSRLGSDSYNDTRNRQDNFSLVADPDGTEVNQALLRYDHALGNAVVGRQRINLDNQRFIGGVGWRQNEQTYDGMLGQLKPLSGMTLTYAYLDNINSIFGPDGQHGVKNNPANIDGHSHLINLRQVFAPELAVTAYHYRLELDNLAFSRAAADPLGTQSSKTTGLRAEGARGDFSYALEYAEQREHADNPLELDSRYSLVELGYRLKGVAFKGGREVLGGDSGPSNRAFQTPLATKHAFQGWADVFLLTPAAGVRDSYLNASVPLAGGTLQVWYHDFRADRGSSQYGEEIDVSYSRAVPGVKGLVATVKYAGYDADDFAVDTEKLWAQLQYTY